MSDLFKLGGGAIIAAVCAMTVKKSASGMGGTASVIIKEGNDIPAYTKKALRQALLVVLVGNALSLYSRYLRTNIDCKAFCPYLW